MVKKEVTRQGKLVRQRQAKGLCGVCGVKPRAIDPRFSRNIEIRAALARGEKIEAVAARFKVTPRLVLMVRDKPAGKPRLMARCEGCLKAQASYEKKRLGQRRQQQQDASPAA